MITNVKTDVQGDHTSPKPKLKKKLVVKFIWKETLNHFHVSCSSRLPAIMIEHKCVIRSDMKMAKILFGHKPWFQFGQVPLYSTGKIIYVSFYLKG